MGEITDLRAQHAGSENRLESASLVKLGVEAIRNRMLAGNLQPDERLHDERLAGGVDVSRPPLREALRLLKQHVPLEELAVHGERSFDATVVRRHGLPLPEDEAASQ
jgi:hypothetical protein